MFKSPLIPAIAIIVGLLMFVGHVTVEKDNNSFCTKMVEIAIDAKSNGTKSYDLQRNTTQYIESHFTDKADAARFVKVSQDVIRRVYRNNNPMEACQ